MIDNIFFFENSKFIIKYCLWKHVKKYRENLSINGTVLFETFVPDNHFVLEIHPLAATLDCNIMVFRQIEIRVHANCRKASATRFWQEKTEENSPLEKLWLLKYESCFGCAIRFQRVGMFDPIAQFLRPCEVEKSLNAVDLHATTMFFCQFKRTLLAHDLSAMRQNLFCFYFQAWWVYTNEWMYI